MNQDFPFDRFLGKLGESKSPQRNSFPQKEETQIQARKEQSQSVESWSNEEIKWIEKQLLENLSQNPSLGMTKFNLFFKDQIQLKRLNEARALFTVSSQQVLDIIKNQYQTLLDQELQKLTQNQCSIEINLQGNPEKMHEQIIQPQGTSNETLFSSSEGNPKFSLPVVEEEKGRQIDSVFINHLKDSPEGQVIDIKKTLENFVVGPSNNLAYATACAVSEAPGKRGKYPCLYIHAPSGLGKTHLLHAVANGIKYQHPSMAICLISSREFLKELIDAFKDKTLDAFQKKYCEKVDVLMIDDIHELKNKTSTQEEFFHIFNELHSQGKQLIFTSDKAPQEITGIEERIISRLQWGLVVDIQKPDVETRLAILKKKAMELDLFLPDEVFYLIASAIKSSIRELEGSLIKLSATADVLDTEIDVALAKEILGLNHYQEQRVITLKRVLESCSHFFQVSPNDLLGKKRSKDLVRSRHIAWYLSKGQVKDTTYKEIAAFYQDRDHSSVIHGVQKITDQMKHDSLLSQQIIEIQEDL